MCYGYLESLHYALRDFSIVLISKYMYIVHMLSCHIFIFFIPLQTLFVVGLLFSGCPRVLHRVCNILFP